MALEISLYLIIAIVCALLLIVVAFLGGDFFDVGMDVHMDAGGDFAPGAHIEPGVGDFAHGLSPVSPPILLTFGASFGAFGTIFETLGFNFWMTPLLAVVTSAVITSAVFFAFTWLFAKTQATTRVDYSKLLGKEATVTVPIRGGGQGQINVSSEERGRILLPAVSGEDQPTDSLVIIERIEGAIATVRKR